MEIANTCSYIVYGKGEVWTNQPRSSSYTKPISVDPKGGHLYLYLYCKEIQFIEINLYVLMINKKEYLVK